MNLLKNKVNTNDFKLISDKSFGQERALYNSKNLRLKNVSFIGKEDGESALKESSNIIIEKCLFALRYPLWHAENIKIISTKFSETCRAGFWYGKEIYLTKCEVVGPKLFRECDDVTVSYSKINSQEVFWKCKKIDIKKTNIESEYGFLQSKNISLDNVEFKGKYSFQYVDNLYLENCELDTKDAFWHAKNVYCKKCKIKGEYLGWYSKNITFDHCVIESHQPLCYAHNIKLIDCKMPNSDLAFEYSSVNGNIKGNINSIKNPLKGRIEVEKIGEIIKNGSKYKSRAKIIVKE